MKLLTAKQVNAEAEGNLEVLLASQPGKFVSGTENLSWWHDTGRAKYERGVTGRYVGVAQKTLVAVGDSRDEIREKVSRLGYCNLLIIFVELKRGSESVGFLPNLSYRDTSRSP